jgi:hypothetical protein
MISPSKSRYMAHLPPIPADLSHPRWTFSTMRSGSAAHANGLEAWSCHAVKRLIAFWSAAREEKLPHWRHCWLSLEKKASTALGDEQEVGVK